MDEEIERLTISVRADTQGFARDVAELRGQLDGPLGSSVTRAGSLIESALGRAVRSGKFGFEDLKRVGLSVLAEIANAALRSAIGGNASNNGGGGSSLVALGTQIAASLLGSPGRATGGPVSPGRAYMVGERGPELFVPTSSGSIAATPGAQGSRDVRISIAVNAAPGTAPEALARSSRQVARAVRNALLRED